MRAPPEDPRLRDGMRSSATGENDQARRHLYVISARNGNSIRPSMRNAFVRASLDGGDGPPARPARPRARRGGRSSQPPRDVVEQLNRIEAQGGDGIVVFDAGQTLAVSSLDRVYYPREGYTKGDVMRYYTRVAPVLLPAIADHPLALRRYPTGIAGDAFYQHKPPEGVPEVVRTALVELETGEIEPRIIGGDLPTLLYTVQLGSVAVNPWHSRLEDLDAPDYAVLDLDPGPRVPFKRTVEVARLVHTALTDEGYDAIVKTSGSRGIHILVPMGDDSTYEMAMELAEGIATRVAEERPDVATVERSITARPRGTVYIDYLQNARGKTLASVFSLRALPGAPVSTPLIWRQLTATLDPTRFTMPWVLKELPALSKRWRRLTGQ